MFGTSLPMRKLRDVLRLTAGGMSSRQEAASLTIGPTTVIDYLLPSTTRNRCRRRNSSFHRWLPIATRSTDLGVPAR